MKNTKVLLLIGSVLLVLSACIDSSETTGGGSETDTGTDENVVSIGYSGPLSGSGAYYGENTLNGLEMAVEEINEEGFEVDGETYNLNLVTLDDQYLPNETASNAKRLVQEEDSPIIYTA